MYYYIIEIPPNQNLIRLQRSLKEALTQLNINGEMAVASPARSAEELTKIALERGYSTIVAVGNDSLVNRIASILADTPAVLGGISAEMSAEMATLFAGSNLKTACQALKKRKLDYLDMGFVYPNKYFLSDAIIQSEEPFECYIEVDNKYALEGKIQEMTMSSDLQFTILGKQREQFKKSWWQKNLQSENLSQFHAETVTISTKRPMPIFVSGKEIVKTPIQLSHKARVLKIITNRDIIQ